MLEERPKKELQPYGKVICHDEIVTSLALCNILAAGPGASTGRLWNYLCESAVALSAFTADRSPGIESMSQYRAEPNTLRNCQSLLHTLYRHHCYGPFSRYANNNRRWAYWSNHRVSRAITRFTTSEPHGLLKIKLK